MAGGLIADISEYSVITYEQAKSERTEPKNSPDCAEHDRRLPYRRAVRVWATLRETNSWMKSFGWKQWTLLAAFGLVLLATGLFSVRAVRRAVYWRLHRDEPVRPWMSVPYVAHSYRVPPQVLYEALGIPHPPHDRRPIKEIAEEQSRSVDEVIATLQSAIARERVSPSPTTPPTPATGRSP